MSEHGDHDALPYDGHNSDLAHLCQICGKPMHYEPPSGGEQR